MAQKPTKGLEDTYSVALLNTADKLTKKIDSLKRGRQSFDRQWKLNLAFYKGKQWSYIDRNLGRIVTLATEDGDKPRFRVRIVSNQIITGAHSLLAKYTKTKPIMGASPSSSSDSDVKAAQMAESLMEHWWGEFQMEDLMGEALLWGIIAGQGYWKITWDNQAGKPMRFMLDPRTNQPIVDEAAKESMKAQMAAFGQQPQETTVYLGDIKIEAMSPFDVFLDPAAKTFSECKYAICVHHLTPDEIRARWRKEVTPDSTAAAQDTMLPFQNAEDAASPTLKRVYVGYFRPQPALPKGRYVVWTNEPNEILQDGPWPFPFNELPLVKFPGLRVPGSVYDTSVVEHAIPLQKELNKTISQIVEYKNLTIKPRVWAPVGSIRQRLTNEPGAVYEFVPIAGLRPEIEQLPSMPPYVFEHLKEVSSRLRDVFSLQEVTEGSVPPNVEAGVAIDLLQEMATDRLAPTVKLIELALERAGNLMLQLAQKYYIEPRMLKIKGSGGGIQVRKFTQADISGGISVNVEAGSGLPRTRAGRQARIQSYVEMGVIKPDQAYKYLDIADLKGVAKMFQADEDMAYREHDKLIQGMPINAMAQAQALQAVESGFNPETGMAWQSPEEAYAFIEQAGLQPLPYENSAMHLDTHGLFLKSVEFEGLPDDAKGRFIQHYSLTLNKIQSETPQEENVRTTLQLKGTIGPTGAAAILSKQGNPEITPDVMAEPPLETWVTDSMDKPDADSAGNDPYTEEERAFQIMQDAVKREQETEHAEEKQVVGLMSEAEKLRKLRADADLAERKAKETSFARNNG